MKTIALTEETAPNWTHSKVLAVVSRSRPQSSAFRIRSPAGNWGRSIFLFAWLCNWTCKLMAFEVDDVATLEQPDGNIICGKFHRGERVFPDIALNETAAEPPLEIQDAFLLRTFVRVDSYALKVEAFHSHLSKSAHRLPVQ